MDGALTGSIILLKQSMRSKVLLDCLFIVVEYPYSCTGFCLVSEAVLCVDSVIMKQVRTCYHPIRKHRSGIH